MSRRPRFTGHDSYPFEAALLRLDVYRLLSVFCASKDIVDYQVAHPGSRFDRLRWMFEEAEASRLLISLAVIARSLIDTVGKSDPLLPYTGKAPVGRLIANTSAKSEPLDFHEACNKIIHADDLAPLSGPLGM